MLYETEGKDPVNEMGMFSGGMNGRSDFMEQISRLR